MTINYYLVNLSMADLMITVWFPIHSLVKELSSQNQYVLPAIFCKIGVFYTGDIYFAYINALALLFFPVLCMVSSVMTLSAISCDRFLAVIFPLWTRFTQGKANYECKWSCCLFTDLHSDILLYLFGFWQLLMHLHLYSAERLLN
jgi:hypothetical protein